MKQFFPRTALALCAALALAGCTILEGEKIDYKSASKGTSLEVPPDLTQLSRDTRYNVPGGAVTATGFQAGQAATPNNAALSSMGDVRVERTGNTRWLVVNRTPDQLWGPVRDFWQENGFLLNVDQANLGIMETDWAENRAKIPQDFIRNTLGKVFDSLYSTGERDKFRTRMERGANGTEIYISHRGMIEVYNNNQKDQTVWQPRATDPELEAEFLRRLMVKLGVTQEQSRAAVAAGVAKPLARATTAGGTPVVLIDEGFDRAWRRVGLSLDRTGFTVEDRDRAQGTYFVRYVEPDPNMKKDPSFLSRIFGGGAPVKPPVKYRIALRSQGESTTVSVLDAGGAPEASASAQRIVQVIADDLK